MHDLPAMIGPDGQMMYEFLLRAIGVGCALGLALIFGGAYDHR